MGGLGSRPRSVWLGSPDWTVPAASQFLGARSLGWQGQARSGLQTLSWRKPGKGRPGNGVALKGTESSAQKSIRRVRAGVKRGPGSYRAGGGGSTQSWAWGRLHRHRHPPPAQLCARHTEGSAPCWTFPSNHRRVFAAAEQREHAQCVQASEMLKRSTSGLPHSHRRLPSTGSPRHGLRALKAPSSRSPDRTRITCFPSCPCPPPSPCSLFLVLTCCLSSLRQRNVIPTQCRLPLIRP